MKRRAFCLGIATIALIQTSAFAQDNYPSRPIKMIVSYAAGGTTDIMARVTAQKMSEIPVSYTHLTLPTNREV